MNQTASETPVPNWAFDQLGKLVTVTTDVEDYPGSWIKRGSRGVLLRVCTKRIHGRPGNYATVAFDLGDLGDESNVELHDLEPVVDEQ